MQVQDPLKSGNIAFPVNKIKLIPKRTNGQANFPTVTQIGMISTNLNNNSEVFIVPSSNAPLSFQSQWANYYYLELFYDLIVEGGAYLQNLKNNRFIGVLRFTAYREDNSIIGIKDINYEVQVLELSGTPPIENRYSISFTTEASNANIEYTSLSDYVNGKTVTYKDGLTVSATTNYEVSVRSIDANFSSDTGDTLPLDIVKLQLLGINANGAPTVLSNSKKVVLQGLSTGGNPVNFDVTYSTNSNDQRLYDSPSRNYSTQLMYEIIPR